MSQSRSRLADRRRDGAPDARGERGELAGGPKASPAATNSRAREEGISAGFSRPFQTPVQKLGRSASLRRPTPEGSRW